MKYVRTVKSLLENQNFLLVLWLVVVLWGVLTKYAVGDYTNYEQYKQLFENFTNSKPLYEDRNHYGIIFAFLIAPFAWLPDWLGMALWVVAGAALLFYAVQALPLEQKYRSLILLIVLNELYRNAIYQQFNIAATALVILPFVFIEWGRESKSAVSMLVGAGVKIYGIAALAFLPFARNKYRFVATLVIVAAVLFALPMVFTDNNYVIGQYRAWLADIVQQNKQNMFAEYQNISLLGLVRKVTGVASYSDLWIVGGGAIMLLVSYLRVKAYRSVNFRLLVLASLLIAIPLFSTGSENVSYIIAIVGVGVWWGATTMGHSRLAWAMLCFAVAASASNLLLPSGFYADVFRQYALKAIPFTIVWLRVIYELYFATFTSDEQAGVGSARRSEVTLTGCDIDVVLPCYNPAAGWAEAVATNYEKLRRAAPDHNFNLIVSNDGSHRNFTTAETDTLKKLVEGVQIVDCKINMGKGAAVRRGVMEAVSPLVIYTDIDFPYQTECMVRMIRELESGECDIMMSKRNESYYKELSPLRRLLSWGSQTLNRKLLGMRYADAQGGLKGFNKVGREIFLQTTIDRFLFDTEFIYKASQRKDIQIRQIEVNLRNEIEMPAMALRVIRAEFVNFLKILFGQLR
ncbi:hypothetical protein BN938_1432 [Mucinivorans hirudinis]|uniref:Glycosyltransferase 2-like domain-containing protein n=1 Tax=Mucinivorans hirudinis TaxID=1433126 RepID=A0A060RD53_9BACT|nr:hypothetical protein BN938_1432 [Mucinivorans hirudinis]